MIKKESRQLSVGRDRIKCIHLISMVSCQKGPTRHAYAWQIGPFWQDTLDMNTEVIYINTLPATGEENFVVRA